MNWAAVRVWALRRVSHRRAARYHAPDEPTCRRGRMSDPRSPEDGPNWPERDLEESRAGEPGAGWSDDPYRFEPPPPNKPSVEPLEGGLVGLRALRSRATRAGSVRARRNATPGRFVGLPPRTEAPYEPAPAESAPTSRPLLTRRHTSLPQASPSSSLSPHGDREAPADEAEHAPPNRLTATPPNRISSPHLPGNRSPSLRWRRSQSRRRHAAPEAESEPEPIEEVAAAATVAGVAEDESELEQLASEPEAEHEGEPTEEFAAAAVAAAARRRMNRSLSHLPSSPTRARARPSSSPSQPPSRPRARTGI